MTNCAELSDYDWLTGTEAAAVLDELACGGQPLVAATARLRRCFSAARTHLMLEQIELRARATAKFARAADMFFTRRGLQQATDQWVARYKARRFASRELVGDYCCGIGGDLLALAGKTATVGVDRDPIAICFAAENARIHGASAAVQKADVSELAASDFGAWHIDPDRRPGGHRTSLLAWSEPDGDAVARMIAANPQAAVKLAPAANVPVEWATRCELEWIGRDRECRQLVAWHGELANAPGWRRATVVTSDGTVARSITGRPDHSAPLARDLGPFVFEPDAAVLAARLTGTLAAQHELKRVSAGIAYLTGPSAIDDPALQCFAVDEVLPLKIATIAELLHQRKIGRLEIKKRGVDHDPQQIRRELKLQGDNSATLLLTQLNRKRVAILARRIERAVSINSPTPDTRLTAPRHATSL